MENTQKKSENNENENKFRQQHSARRWHDHHHILYDTIERVNFVVTRLKSKCPNEMRVA